VPGPDASDARRERAIKPLITPENFYSLPQLPFNIHLGMEFERPDPGAGARLRLPASPTTLDGDGTIHRSAMYTLGEVAAAVSVLDNLVEALPVFLLTLGGELRPVQRAHGAIWTSARVEVPAEEAVESLRARRKRQFTAHVSVFDDHDKLVAEMSATFLARVLSATMTRTLAAQTG
jgi:acyl-coenzyme A thioesterase PaaI-like protein